MNLVFRSTYNPQMITNRQNLAKSDLYEYNFKFIYACRTSLPIYLSKYSNSSPEYKRSLAFENPLAFRLYKTEHNGAIHGQFIRIINKNLMNKH